MTPEMSTLVSKASVEVILYYAASHQMEQI